MFNKTIVSPALKVQPLSFSGVPFQNASGVQLPGITEQSRKATLELLHKNHNNFNIFINEKAFHNHFVHHLLAAYSCGASPDLLKRIYEKHKSYQRPKPPQKVKITHENWEEHLGKNE